MHMVRQLVEITMKDSETAVHVVLVSVKRIILSMIEGTNDGASKEHGGETVGAREYYGCMGR